MSSVGFELGKEQVCKKYFREKMHHTEYGVRMSSVKTEVGETTGIKDFFQSYCITLSMALACRQ